MLSIDRIYRVVKTSPLNLIGYSYVSRVAASIMGHETLPGIRESAVIAALDCDAVINRLSAVGAT
jgi:hypothetical protein